MGSARLADTGLPIALFANVQMLSLLRQSSLRVNILTSDCFPFRLLSFRGNLMTTLHDVARLAGVSTATVSHVINNTRRVSSATTARVQSAIAQLKFVPNPIGRLLARQEIVPGSSVPATAASTESSSVEGSGRGATGG